MVFIFSEANLAMKVRNKDIKEHVSERLSSNVERLTEGAEKLRKGFILFNNGFVSELKSYYLRKPNSLDDPPGWRNW